MNVFADRLFAILLGWTVALFNGVWNLVSDNSAGIGGFLQRFWLPLIFVLLAFGTACDYIIWLVRWRPYYVWRTWFRRQDSRRRLSITRNYMENLDHSPLDLPEYREGQFVVDQAQAVDEPVFINFAPLPEQTGEEILLDAPILWTSVSTSEYQDDKSPYTEYNAAPVQLQDNVFYPEPPAYQADIPQDVADYLSYAGQDELIGQDPFYPSESRISEAGQMPGALSRRRRAGSRRRRSGILHNIKDALFNREDNDATFDSLPPPVDQGDAYHKPFYPQNYSYRPNPNQLGQNEDKTQR